MAKKNNARKNTSRFGAIEKDILEQLSLGDLLYGFLLSSRSTRRMHQLARERAKIRYRRKLALTRLEEQGLVRRCGEQVSLSDSGEAALDALIGEKRDMLKTQARWDKRWRIVSYDIPEKKKGLRDKVRHVLKRVGFIELHHSLWVFPYDCRELTDLLIKETRLGEHLVFGVVELPARDAWLRARFGL